MDSNDDSAAYPAPSTRLHFESSPPPSHTTLSTSSFEPINTTYDPSTASLSTTSYEPSVAPIAPPKIQKELKFVTNYGAPHPKRRRIGAACLTCRKRKTACSGERPSCETCRQNRLECSGYAGEGNNGSIGVGNGKGEENGGKERVTEEDEMKNSTANGKGEATKSASGAGKKTARKRGVSSDVVDETIDDISAETATGIDTEPGLKNPEISAPESLFSGPRNRMPYFRWLGPTAIMPGFKQMVVKVRRGQDGEMGARSSSDGGLGPGALSSPSLNNATSNGDPRPSSLFPNTPATAESDARTPLNLPFYDTSPMPPSELITHLANTFFTHLGCNYPFLQRERFLKDLEEKQVDAILVDAVCALAARFSTHSLLKQQRPDESSKLSPAEYGHAFANRAKTALTDAFTCPSVAAVQAALLLAYNEFGESRDSGLWMYLGIAIRMAEDLGMHKLEGLKYKGMTGPTPKMVKRESRVGSSSISKYGKKTGSAPTSRPMPIDEATNSEEHSKAIDEQKAVEQERVDTFWAVFFLDRVVSSGTGRRSTLRDKDIELSFPPLDEKDKKTGWPAPFPALIRIVHLYGRVADLLNSFKELADLTSDTPKRLAAMENQVTEFYQGLSPRLHFDAVSFQHYMKAGEGTNFVLLHFWFHTLIVLLHQPTLLKTFEGRMLQLFPNSQQLSMSSAKTIADILSYSQLMDAKASLGNPFTTQPIYIAACAFLKETAEQTATSNAHSRASTPSRRSDNSGTASGNLRKLPHSTSSSSTTTPKRTPPRPAPPPAPRAPTTLAKHTLLATAATQHYQLCYSALQSLEKFWSGTKYILTILDQKSQGVEDPLLYTAEEGDAALERPRPEPAFTKPGWRRKVSLSGFGGREGKGGGEGLVLGLGIPVIGQGAWNGFAPLPGGGTGSPAAEFGRAIGWTLTGDMNSQTSQLAWHYPGLGAEFSGAMNDGRGEMIGFAGAQQQQPMTRAHLSAFPTGHSAAELFAGSARYEPGTTAPFQASNQQQQPTQHLPALSNDLYTTSPRPAAPSPFGSAVPFGGTDALGHGEAQPVDFQFSDMMIESQDVDMSLLGLDMMPWFDSYPAIAGGEQEEGGGEDGLGGIWGGDEEGGDDGV